jgi:hypothetical protein
MEVGMKDILLAIAMILLAITISILTMMLGWGVQPKSWGWIITGYIISMVMSGLYGAVLKK